MTIDGVSTVAAPAPAPVMKPDMRPTADAAALARDPRPHLPLPIPAGYAQSGAITASKVSSSAGVEIDGSVKPTERVLKPFGVAMLPETADPASEPPKKQDSRAKEREEAESPADRATRAVAAQPAAEEADTGISRPTETASSPGQRGTTGSETP